MKPKIFLIPLIIIFFISSVSATIYYDEDMCDLTNITNSGMVHTATGDCNLYKDDSADYFTRALSNTSFGYFTVETSINDVTKRTQYDVSNGGGEGFQLRVYCSGGLWTWLVYEFDGAETLISGSYGGACDTNKHNFTFHRNVTTNQWGIYVDNSGTRLALSTAGDDATEYNTFKAGVDSATYIDANYYNVKLSTEFNELPPPPTPLTSYFEIIMNNVNIFNASVDGTPYTTTNGTIITTVNSSIGSLIDLNISAGQHFTLNVANWNSSDDYIGSLDIHPILNVFNGYNNSNITGYWINVDGNTYMPSTHPTLNNGYIYIPLEGVYNTTFYDPNNEYLDVINKAVTYARNGTSSFKTYQSINFFNLFEKVTGNSINVFNVTSGLASDETINGTAILGLNAGDQSVNVDSADYFSSTNFINTSFQSDSIIYNLTVYNSQLTVTPRDFFTNNTISNFTVTVNSSNGFFQTAVTSSDTLVFNLTKNVNYTVTTNVTNYATNTTYLTTINESAESLDIYLFKENSVYIRIYDEETSLLIDNQSVNIEFIGDSLAVENTTSNGALIVEPLIQGSYRIRYSSEGYPERVYFVDVEGGSTQAIDVYLLKGVSATNITAVVYDEKGDFVEGSYIKLLRYYIDCNCYKTVEVGETNYAGETGLRVDFNDEFYKFIIEYNNVVYLETTPSKITGSPLTFRITLEVLDPTIILKRFQNLVYDLYYNNNTNNFVYTFSDTNNGVSSGCLKVYESRVSSQTLFSSSCVNSTGATLLINVPVVNGSTYKAVASVYYNGDYQHVDTIFKSWSVGKEVLGSNIAVLLVIFLVITFAFISIFNPSVSVVLVAFALIVSTSFGILNLGLTALMGIVGVVIIILLQNRS